MRGFLKLFPDKLKIFHEFKAFWKISRLFQYIFKEVEAFVPKCEAFVKITRLLKYIFREVEAFLY
jgi:hypothetical protein